MEPGTETEIKLRAASVSEARERLRRAGASLVRERLFEDNLLLDDERGSLRGSGRVLRLRREAGRGVLTFKGPGEVVSGVKSRQELETTVKDADALQRILAAAGLLPRFRYQKYRETWRHGAVEIVVDELPIGVFLEIEGPAAEIHAAAAELGFRPADYVLESYVALFFEAGGQGDMVFPERP